jgi:signal peptidase I
MKIFRLSLIIILVAGCTGNTYRVTTDSMSNTFNTGQVLELKKKTSIDKGDIVFFRPNMNPKNQEEIWLFRVVASSGDILEIKDGNVIVNGSLIELPENARVLYNIALTSPLNVKDFRENTVKQIGEGKYIAYLTKSEYSNISKLQNITSIERIVKSHGELSKGIVRNNSYENWNEDQFGPLTIPSPGGKIRINQTNKELYREIISGLEPDSTVLIKEKLYFLMGDNRSNAVDSRYIGLITESDIIGYAEEGH